MTNATQKRRPTNFDLYQGSTFYFYHRMVDEGSGDPIDITDYTFEMHIKKDYADPTPLITLTEANGRITHEDDADGLILVKITAADTGTLPIDLDCAVGNPPFEKWAYDLEADANVFPPGKFRTLFGTITAYAEVTK